MNWIKIRQWTWEFPQTLLGFILTLIYNNPIKVISYKEHKVYIYDEFPGGISLGKYILVDYNRTDLDLTVGRMKLTYNIKHEYGHGIQSKWFGWFYLPIPGLLSLSHNIICKIKRFYDIDYDYYKFFIEYWANKLGGNG